MAQGFRGLIDFFQHAPSQNSETLRPNSRASHFLAGVKARRRVAAAPIRRPNHYTRQVYTWCIVPPWTPNMHCLA